MHLVFIAFHKDVLFLVEFYSGDICPEHEVFLSLREHPPLSVHSSWKFALIWINPLLDQEGRPRALP